jgi:hypothetical protein
MLRYEMMFGLNDDALRSGIDDNANYIEGQR